MSEGKNTETRTPSGAGHVSVHLSHMHPMDVTFSFETQAPRLSGAMGVSLLLHGLAAVVIALLAAWLPTLQEPIDGRNADDSVNDQIVWLSQPGPGGGGGGGGNKSIEPPRLAELPGQDKITVPVLKPPDVTPQPEPPKDIEAPQTFNIPAEIMASAEKTQIGVMEGMPSSNSTTSTGSGSGGGAGTGTGTGIGPGSGSGLGPGTGGGFGGGAYRPGAGIELPRLLNEVKPAYTPDAMRAKIQGKAVLDCVVGVDGMVGECNVVRSLDANYGLDQEAVKAARQWKFVPGRRLGKPVAVLVTIEMEFYLR